MPRPTTVVAPRVAADVLIDVAAVPDIEGLDVVAEVKGLRPGGPVILWCEELDEHLALGNAFCSAIDELTFRLVNPTGSDITPGEITFRVVQF